jgi:hypothetical protein
MLTPSRSHSRPIYFSFRRLRGPSIDSKLFPMFLRHAQSHQVANEMRESQFYTCVEGR